MFSKSRRLNTKIYLVAATFTVGPVVNEIRKRGIQKGQLSYDPSDWFLELIAGGCMQCSSSTAELSRCCVSCGELVIACNFACSVSMAHWRLLRSVLNSLSVSSESQGALGWNPVTRWLADDVSSFVEIVRENSSLVLSFLAFQGSPRAYEWTHPIGTWSLLWRHLAAMTHGYALFHHGYAFFLQDEI